jgi:maltose alpha-D-glucosyltransferase/alpha-amylase
MQWTGDRNAGFSRCDAAALYAPLIVDPVFGYSSVNVEAQERLTTSLLHWMRRLLQVRKRHARGTFGRGSFETLDCDNHRIFAYLRAWGGETVVCVNNLSRYVQGVSLDLRRFAGAVPVEMIGGTRFPAIEKDRNYFLSLGPHGFYWFRLDAHTTSNHTGSSPSG